MKRYVVLCVDANGDTSPVEDTFFNSRDSALDFLIYTATNKILHLIDADIKNIQTSICMTTAEIKIDCDGDKSWLYFAVPLSEKNVHFFSH